MRLTRLLPIAAMVIALTACSAADRIFGDDTQETIALRAAAQTFNVVACQLRRRIARKFRTIDVGKRVAHGGLGDRVHAR